MLSMIAKSWVCIPVGSDLGCIVLQSELYMNQISTSQFLCLSRLHEMHMRIQSALDIRIRLAYKEIKKKQQQIGDTVVSR